MHYEMKIQTFNDGTATKKNIYEFETRDEALADAKYNMGIAMKQDTTASIGIYVLSDEFELQLQDYWKKAVEK